MLYASFLATGGPEATGLFLGDNAENTAWNSVERRGQESAPCNPQQDVLHGVLGPGERDVIAVPDALSS
jgi:hypothetical protein